MAPCAEFLGMFRELLFDGVGQEGRDLRAAGRHGADREADRAPRIQAFHERDQSCAVIQSEPLTGMISSGDERWREARCRVSPTANRPTTTMMTSMPSSSSSEPKVKRA
jgi:hypothetical protein